MTEKTMDELIREISDPYTREEFNRDRARIIARICEKHGIDESQIESLIAEHRYVHDEEDIEQDYIELLAISQIMGWSILP